MMPNISGFVVIKIYGDPKFLFRKTITSVDNRFCQQFPRQHDGAFFKIVSKREISTHLEEGGMASGFADFINIQSADAFLD